MRPPVYVMPSSAPPDPEDVEDAMEAEVAEAEFRTRKHYWRGIVWLLVALGIQFLANLMPDVVEKVYSQGFYPFLNRVLSIPSKILSSVVLGEILFLLIIGYFFVWTLWYFNRSWRRSVRLFHVIQLFFLHLLWVFSILFPIFLFVWGLNYQRMPLADTLGLDRRPAARTGELEAIGIQLINFVNTNYDRARVGQEWPSASKLPTTLTVPMLKQVIENAFQAEEMLGTAKQGGYVEPKQMSLSSLTTLFGVSGFYIAYTTEVAYNAEVPPVDLPMTIAHHKAHQRGFAREDEANFIGFLICAKASDPYVRYSGFMHALRVLEPLSKGDPAKYQDLYSRIGVGPRADLVLREDFWGTSKSTYFGPMSRRLFDMYLRANRVEGGVKNYDEDIYLMTSYFLRNLNPLLQTVPPQAQPSPTPDLTEPET